MRKNISAGLIAALVCLLACTSPGFRGYNISKRSESSEGMVVSAHPIATEVGVDILESGGNAIDAMVAIHFALAVVYPRAGNLGGGGFMVYRSASGEAFSLDYREKAPAAASRDMYLDSDGNVLKDLSMKGHLASGVPGTVAGVLEAHRRFGKLPLDILIGPSIAFARDGFYITASEARRLNQYANEIMAFNSAGCPFVKPAGWSKGDLLIQPELAETLTRISWLKANGFYHGKVADLIVAEMKSGNGLITHDDLKGYEPVWRQPLTNEYDNYRIISMPPSSSGGIALIQMLEMIEPFPIDQWGFQTAESMHLMIEAERRAYADRAMYLGDMDFFDIPLDTILDSTYLRRRMEDFEMTAATSSDVVRAGELQIWTESYETTHFSVVDREGNAVAVTTTLNSNYGSKVWVDGAGFFLNNEMDDFSAKPGVPNQFGLIGAEANAIQPGKRMLSSMTPTIIERDGDLYMTLGTPGGATIITSVFQVFLNVVEFGLTPSVAVQAPRFHHQWQPDEIVVEAGVANDSIRSVMAEMGHVFREVEKIGMVEMILKDDNGTYIGIADRRGDDHAAGPYN